MHNELFTALSKAQSEMSGATKDSTNPFFKSNYADLESVWTSIRGPLTKNGLSIIQITTIGENGRLELITTLGHSSGQSIFGTYPIISKDNSPQALGSAISYARRYTLAAMVGVVQVDDDGNMATKGTEATKQERYSPKVVEPNTLPNSAFNSTKPAPSGDLKVTGPSEAQLKRLYALKRSANWSDDEVKTYMREKFSIEHSKDMSVEQYKILTDCLAKNMTYDAAVTQ
jgi:hypothetical protein